MQRISFKDSNHLSIVFVIFSMLPLLSNVIVFLYAHNGFKHLFSSTDLISTILAIFGSMVLTKSLSDIPLKNYSRKLKMTSCYIILTNFIIYLFYWPNLMIGISQYIDTSVVNVAGFIFGFVYLSIMSMHINSYLMLLVPIFFIVLMAVLSLKLSMKSKSPFKSIGGGFVFYVILSIPSLSASSSLALNAILAITFILYTSHKQVGK